MDRNKEFHKRWKSLIIISVNLFLISLLLTWILHGSPMVLSGSVSGIVFNATQAFGPRNLPAYAKSVITSPWIISQNQSKPTKGIFHLQMTEASPHKPGVYNARNIAVKSNSNEPLHELGLFLKPEEIFKLQTPFPFAPDYKNPCFKVKVQYKCPERKPRNRNVRKFCKKLTDDSVTEMACLPYFFIIGFTKSGTTDMCKWLAIHQDVKRSSHKEMHYWDPIHKTHLLSDYIFKGFGSMAAAVNDGTDNSRQLIAGECTPRTAWGAGQRSAELGSAGLPHVNVSDPHMLTPFRIAHVLPNLKIIVTMRNPVTRLWSHFFHNMRRSVKNYAEYFHRRVVDGIQWMKDCTVQKKLPLKVCSYGSNFMVTYDLPNLRDDWHTKYGGAYKMRIGLYHVFLKDWLSAFPKENILFIRFEDYVKSPREYMEHHVLPHLGVGAYAEDPEVQKQISQKKRGVKNRNRAKPPITDMRSETMELLREFYKPHNERLAQLLNDTKYLEWNDI